MEKKFHLNTMGIVLLSHIILISTLLLDVYLHLDFVNYLRVVIGFLYLTFIPGFVIFNLLSIKTKSNVENIFLVIALSISFIMFVGVIIDFIYPLFGYLKPLSLYSLILTFSVILIPLSIFGHLKINGFKKYIKFNLKSLISNQSILFILFPLLSIYAAYLVTYYKNSLAVMTLIFIIALTIIFYSRISEKLHSLYLFTTAFSLLLSISMIGIYLSGYADVNYQFYVASITNNNLLWDRSLPGLTNSIISISIIPVVYSQVLSSDLVWIFKVIFPFIIALIPVVLYQIYRNFLDKKNALLAVLFFISMGVFFRELPYLLSQAVAEFFLVMLLFTLINLLTETKNISIGILTIIFTSSLIVSHYSTAIIFLVGFLAIPLILYLDRFLDKIRSFLKFNPNNYNIKNIDTNLIIFFAVFFFSWYIYITNSYTITAIVNLFNTISQSFFIDFFNSGGRELTVYAAIGLGPESQSFIQSFNRVIFYLTEIFIITGFLSVLFTKTKKLKINNLYYALMIYSMLILFLTIVTPFLGASLHVTRIYHISLILLSPLFVIGGQQISLFLYNQFKKWSYKKILQHYQIKKILILLVLIPYFLLNTGFLYSTIPSAHIPYPLGIGSIDENKDIDQIAGYYNLLNVERDVYGSYWLSNKVNYKDKQNRIFADQIALDNVLNSYGHIGIQNAGTFDMIKKPKKNDYIFLRYFNTKYNFFVNNNYSLVNYTSINVSFDQSNLIYSNGGTVILAF